MNKDKITHAEARKIASELGTLLGERHYGAIGQINRIIRLCGVDFAREMYAAAAEIEANGGMMLPDNSGRRTPGGVFLHLVRAKLDDDQKKRIFSSRAHVGIPLFAWKRRIAIIDSLKAEAGTIKSLTVSLRGRVEQVEKHTDFVVITLWDDLSIDNLPRVLPRPPSTPTVAVVYVALDQWEKVEAIMTNPSDRLLVEGCGAVEPETKSVVVFATSVQTEPLGAKKPQKTKANAGTLT